MNVLPPWEHMKILLMVCWEKNESSALTQMPVENVCIAAASLWMRMGYIFAKFYLILTSTNDMQVVYFILFVIVYAFRWSLLCLFTFISNSLGVIIAVHVLWSIQIVQIRAEYYSKHYVGSTAVLGQSLLSLVESMCTLNIWTADNTYVWPIIGTRHCWHSLVITGCPFGISP